MAEQCTRTALKIKSKEKPRGKVDYQSEHAHKMICVLYTVLIIAGTTAVGKTDLSLELAKLLDIEVISVDSAQVHMHSTTNSTSLQASLATISTNHHDMDNFAHAGIPKTRHWFGKGGEGAL